MAPPSSQTPFLHLFLCCAVLFSRPAQVGSNTAERAVHGRRRRRRCHRCATPMSNRPLGRQSSQASSLHSSPLVSALEDRRLQLSAMRTVAACGCGAALPESQMPFDLSDTIRISDGLWSADFMSFLAVACYLGMILHSANMQAPTQHQRRGQVRCQCNAASKRSLVCNRSFADGEFCAARKWRARCALQSQSCWRQRLACQRHVAAAAATAGASLSCDQQQAALPALTLTRQAAGARLIIMQGFCSS